MTLTEEDVRERGLRVPTLQAYRAALRLPRPLSGRGGSAESSLGHRRPLLPVPVGVLLPVRVSAPRGGRGGGGCSVELLLHAHFWYDPPFTSRFWLLQGTFYKLDWLLFSKSGPGGRVGRVVTTSTIKNVFFLFIYFIFLVVF